MCNFLFLLLFTDASSSNEAVHLQQRLKSLSTELLTLRNRLHVGPTAAGTGGGGGGVTGNSIVNGVNNNTTIGNGNFNNNAIHSSSTATTVNNSTSSPVIPITNSNKFNNKVKD